MTPFDLQQELSDRMKEQLLKKYEKTYGKLGSGHYITFWISKNNNVMVRHMVEEHEWTSDTLIREINLGRLSENNNL